MQNQKSKKNTTVCFGVLCHNYEWMHPPYIHDIDTRKIKTQFVQYTATRVKIIKMIMKLYCATIYKTVVTPKQRFITPDLVFVHSNDSNSLAHTNKTHTPQF